MRLLVSSYLLSRTFNLRFYVFIVAFVFAAAVYTTMTLAGGSTAQMTEQKLLVEEEPGPTSPVDASGMEHPVFTRIITSSAERNITLPVAAENSTIIAYHGTGDTTALPFTPIGSRMNGGLVSRTLKGVFSGRAPIRYYLLQDDSGGDTETTSVDVGAPPGTPVSSPVSGEIIGVKTYLLHGKYEDVQVDIRPEGLSGETLSLLFITEPTVEIGQTWRQASHKLERSESRWESWETVWQLSLIHISEPTRLRRISYAVFCLKK